MKATHYALFLLLALFGCKDCSNDPSPSGTRPQPTTDGRNTFCCEINGKPYYQRFTGGQPTFPTITGSYSSDLSIEGMDFWITYPDYENTENICFTGNKIFTKGKFELTWIGEKVMMYYWKKNACNYQDVYKYNSMSGYIEFLRYDHNAGIYSGTFEFKNWLPDSVSNGCDTLKVTNGVFDIKL